MGSTRVSPNQQARNRQALRKAVPVDTAGMSDEEKGVFSDLSKHQNNMTGIGRGAAGLPRATPPKTTHPWWDIFGR